MKINKIHKALLLFLASTIIVLFGVFLYSVFFLSTEVIQENESEKECGKKPVFSEFLGRTQEEMTRYDPTLQELDAFNALFEEWNNCIDTLSWQAYRNEELGFEVKYPKEINFEIDTLGIQGTLGSRGDLKFRTFIGEEIVLSVYALSSFKIVGSGGFIYYNQEAKEWYLADSYNPIGFKDDKIKKFELSNGAIVYEIPFGVIGFSEINKAIIGDDLLYVFSGDVSYNPEDSEAYEQATQQLNEISLFIDQILSTFKFFELVDISTWQIFTNTKYGYSIAYPPSFKIFGSVAMATLFSLDALGEARHIVINDSCRLVIDSILEKQSFAPGGFYENRNEIKQLYEDGAEVVANHSRDINLADNDTKLGFRQVGKLDRKTYGSVTVHEFTVTRSYSGIGGYYQEVCGPSSHVMFFENNSAIIRVIVSDSPEYMQIISTLKFIQ